MRNRMAMVLTLVVLALVVVAAQTDVTGRWEMTINTDQGALPGTLTLQQDGEALSGSLISDQGTLEFDGGTVSENKIEWVVEVDAGGQFIEISMNGVVDGDMISGTMDFGGYGGGDWTAKRAQ